MIVRGWEVCCVLLLAGGARELLLKYEGIENPST